MADEEEAIETLPDEDKNNDELMRAKVAKKINGKLEKGVVEDIEVGQISRDRLYRIRYEDGDLEHMTEEEVRGVVVALADPAERVMTVTGASEEAAVLKRPAAKALEVVAEEDVEMGAPVEDVRKKPAGRAKAKAKAVDPVVHEEEEPPEEPAVLKRPAAAEAVEEEPEEGMEVEEEAPVLKKPAARAEPKGAAKAKGKAKATAKETEPAEEPEPAEKDEAPKPK